MVFSEKRKKKERKKEEVKSDHKQNANQGISYIFKSLFSKDVLPLLSIVINQMMVSVSHASLYCHLRCFRSLTPPITPHFTFYFLSVLLPSASPDIGVVF
jgi:hypothetical protein